MRLPEGEGERSQLLGKTENGEIFAIRWEGSEQQIL